MQNQLTANRERTLIMTNTATIKVFDNYEISPCRRFEEPDSPGRFYFEVCEPSEADVWTLYGHINGEGVEAIGDFASEEAAEEIYFRMIGQPFTGSYKLTSARLRLMHAASGLLEALRLAQTALNIASRFQVGDTDSYDIAAIVDKAIKTAMVINE
jgi:hypothetical protein